jgi:zinc protease
MKNRRLPMRTLTGLLTAAIFFCPVSNYMANAAGTKSTGSKSGSSKNAQASVLTAFEQLTKQPVNGLNVYRMKSNGLTVLIQEQNLAPVVSVMMVYGIGSRNEAVGYTGSTHFLEHLMFKGTKKYDPMLGTGIDDTLKPIGGINNATTSQDRTNYYEVAPSQHVGLLLDLEADRMRNLLLREDDRSSEMTVVRNELERGEDDPDELLMSSVYATAFREHPYHHPTIGWRSDVENVPTERLRKFYHDFYWPENASLIVVGDIKKDTVLADILNKFGRIQKGQKKLPTVYTKEPPQEGERRFTVVRGQDVPRLLLGFHTVKATDKDTYPLEVLQSILGDKGKTSSRLYRALVDNGLAVDAYAFNNVMRDPGLFVVGATPAKEVGLKKLERAVRAAVGDLANTEPTEAEVNRAKLEITKRYRLDAVDCQGRAEQIGDAIGVADWKWWTTYCDNIAKVTPQQVQAAAKKYLNSNNLTVGYYRPKTDQNELGMAAENEAESSTDSASGIPLDETSATARGDQSKVLLTGAQNSLNIQSVREKETVAINTEPGKTPALPGSSASVGDAQLEPLKIVSRKRGIGKLGSRTETLKFDNGLTVIVLPMPGSGTVTISGKIKAGRYFLPNTKSKVPGLAAELLTKGSSKYSKFKISEILESMGTSLDFSADSFFAGFNVDVVASDAKAIVPLIADVMQKPLFEQEEFDKARKILESNIEERKANTTSVAWMSLRHALYKPESIYYANTFEDQLEHLKTVTRDDLVNFHKNQFTPANTVFTFVGDIKTDEVADLIAKEFASYKGSKEDTISIDPTQVNNSFAGRRIMSNLPDKTNMDVVIGCSAPVSIKSKDYFAESLASAALGYDSFACRLAPLRDKYGLTYSITSSLTEASYPDSIWAISYSVAPENLEKAQVLITQIVKQYVKEGISTAELAREKGHLTGVYVVESRSPRTIASQLGYSAIMGLPLDFLENFTQRVNSETQSSVNAAIRKYFQLDKCVTAIAGWLKQDKASGDHKPVTPTP